MAPTDEQTNRPVPDLSTPEMKRGVELMTVANGGARDHLQEIGVAILGMRNGEPAEIGSGTCVQIGTRYLIATAEHVIAPYADDSIALITSQERRERRRWTPQIVRRGMDKLADVAWLEIDPTEAPQVTRRFIGLDRFAAGRSHVPDLVTVYGFPRDMIRLFREEQGIGAQPVSFATYTLDSAERPADAVDARDLYLDWPPYGLIGPNGEPVDAFEPFGISGGGIWTMEMNGTGVWSPDSMKLIGIENSWVRWKWVKGSQIQHWLALVARDLPELADEIRPHLGAP